MNGFTEIFSSDSFMPHGHCFLWIKELLALHVISDALIFLAYFSIPVALWYFVRKRRDIEFRWMFVLFGAFILACGITHAFGIWVMWNPSYWLSGGMKAITALVSISTAIYLWYLMPVALSIPSPTQLKQANDYLEMEVEERSMAIAAMEASEESFRTAFQYAPIGKALVSLTGKWMKVNQALCDLVGYSEKELLTIDFQSITHYDDLKADLGYVNELIAGKRDNYRMEKRYIHKDGHLIWIQLAVALVRDNEGNPLYFISQIEDISELKRVQAAMEQMNHALEQRVNERTRELEVVNTQLEISNSRLQQLARYDDLTGLYNRRYFMEILESNINSSQRYNVPLCIMMMDVDHFKSINDTHGHVFGDKIISLMGRLIRESLRDTDIFGRYGGDEFCIGLTHTSIDSALELSEKLRLCVEQEEILANDGVPMHITTSIGVASWRPGIQTLKQLMQHADQALYRAKENGRNRVAAYSFDGSSKMQYSDDQIRN